MNDFDVSVVIPHYDSSSLITQALESIAQQTSAPREIVIVDDASSGAERARLKVIIEASNLPIVLIQQHNNAGPGVARNVGWSRAQGAYVAFLDADDEWHPRKLELMAAAARKHPDALLLCHRVGPSILSSVDASPLTIKLIYREMLLRNGVVTSSALIKRSVMARFPSTPRYSEDFSLWLDISYASPILRVEELLGVRVASPTGLSARVWRMEIGELSVLNRQRRAGRIGGAHWLFISVWSLAKFLLRLIQKPK